MTSTFRVLEDLPISFHPDVILAILDDTIFIRFRTDRGMAWVVDLPESTLSGLTKDAALAELVSRANSAGIEYAVVAMFRATQAAGG